MNYKAQDFYMRFKERKVSENIINDNEIKYYDDYDIEEEENDQSSEEEYEPNN